MIKQALSFVAVVKAGSYSTAAKNISVSKAQLSRHINQLEEFLGIQLLFRTTRTLMLTESGDEFFQSCASIQEDYDDAINNLKQDFQATKGTLRITAPITYGSENLTPLISKFSAQYPNIKPILSLSSSASNLLDDNYDVAIRIASSLPDSDLKVRKIASFDTLLCASKNLLSKHETPLSPDALTTLPCITSVNRSYNTKIHWPFYLKDTLVKIKPNAVIEMDGQRAQVSLAKAGVGIIKVFKSFVEQDLKEKTLIELLPDFKQPKMHAYLLYPNRKILPKKIRLFNDFLFENLHLMD